MTCFVSRPSGITLVKFHSLQATITTNILCCVEGFIYVLDYRELCDARVMCRNDLSFFFCCTAVRQHQFTWKTSKISGVYVRFFFAIHVQYLQLQLSCCCKSKLYMPLPKLLTAVLQLCAWLSVPVPTLLYMAYILLCGDKIIDTSRIWLLRYFPSGALNPAHTLFGSSCGLWKCQYLNLVFLFGTKRSPCSYAPRVVSVTTPPMSRPCR